MVAGRDGGVARTRARAVSFKAGTGGRKRLYEYAFYYFPFFNPIC